MTFYLRLIAKFRLVSKDWNSKVIPKVHFRNLKHSWSEKCWSISNIHERDKLKKLLLMGVGGLQFFISEMVVDDELIQLLKNSSTISNVNLLKVETDGQDLENFVAIYKNLPGLDTVYLSGYLFKSVSPHIFKSIKHLHLYKFQLEINLLIHSIDIIQLEELSLYNEYDDLHTSHNLDPFYLYLSTNKSLQRLLFDSGHNKSVMGNFSSLVTLLNTNETLTDITLNAYCNDDMASNNQEFSITNKTVKILNTQKSRNIPMRWRCESKLQEMEIPYLDLNELTVIQSYHKSLKSLTIQNTPKNLECMIKLMKFGSLESLKIKPQLSHPRSTAINDSEFFSATCANPYIKTIQIDSIVQSRYISQLLRCNHPSLTSLSFVPEDHSILPDIKNDLMNNKNIQSLTFRKLLKLFGEEANTMFKIITQILEKNTNITEFYYPYLYMETEELAPIFNRSTSSLLKIALFKKVDPKLKLLLDNNFIENVNFSQFNYY
ncbi:hypothetical protein DLAC_08905 [Tieghemostelium lacteum]|uniref:Uncharacterized protein n=1 Tax=Tieghemostelium lacteum TaxID=361077 RepID=A0A151Z8K2_TIELA|nr:hypothetical protein DLAC_08905 [Tieghemostelium lacteum]|eukprot:KYQ90303.1 hypothetical protein DLAC_08905 [Tieghemostelium lacteum]